MKKEKFEVICTDGVKLKGVLLIPEKPKAVIQFNCGTGTRKELYLTFLTFLAEHGYLCCLWDYRGSGDSAPQDLKHCNFKYSDYGIKDMPAIKDYLNSRFPDLPFFFVAHSAGGQQIGFMHNLDQVSGAVNLAVSTGYYPNMPWKYRLRAYFFFYLFAPASILLTGYVSARKFGLMEDLPKNVVHEWRSWCSKRNYFFDKKFYGHTVPEGHFQKFDYPIHVFWTVDDTISNQKNTEAFWQHIRSKKGIRFTRLTPGAFGVRQIDHFGFFRKVMKEQLWTEIVAILDNWYVRVIKTRPELES